MRNSLHLKRTYPWSKTTALMVLASIALTQLKIADAQSTQSPNPVVIASNKSSKSSKAWEYLRLKRDSNNQPLALQTSITRFKSKDNGLIIDLIGAVHIGEKSYYELLNRQFDLYDVVLYELVAPEGTRIPRNAQGRKSSNPISVLQQSAQKLLGLESQLALIDYQKKNFEHADMSPEQIGEKMRERGETPFSIGMNAFSEMMKNQGKMAKQLQNNDSFSSFANESLFDLMSKPLKLKQLLAAQFTADGVMESGMGETLNRMLIDDRNAAAMEVLHKQLKAGHQHIAVFYGAAHMPDFKTRLADELEMYPVKQVWVDAWDLTKAPKKGTSPMGLMMDMLKQMSQ